MNRRFNYIVFIALLIILFGCEQEPIFETEDRVLTENEKKLVGQWKYQDLLIGTDTVNFLSEHFEPVISGLEYESVRLRSFQYFPDRRYFYIGNVFLAIYGEDGSPNYQPNHGYWEISDDGSIMIHNGREDFKTEYRIIELNEDRFIREYDRIIQETSDTLKWQVGDTVVYREVFVPFE